MTTHGISFIEVNNKPIQLAIAAKADKAASMLINCIP